MTIRTAYLNIIHGDDATAVLDDPTKPFRGWAAANQAIREVADPAAGIGTQIIDQGAADPAKFAKS